VIRLLLVLLIAVIVAGTAMWLVWYGSTPVKEEAPRDEWEVYDDGGGG
jgi:hypothetical protein